MSDSATREQISEAEIELCVEIALRVFDFLKSEKKSMVDEAIMRRIELVARKTRGSA